MKGEASAMTSAAHQHRHPDGRKRTRAFLSA